MRYALSILVVLFSLGFLACSGTASNTVRSSVDPCANGSCIDPYSPRELEFPLGDFTYGQQITWNSTTDQSNDVVGYFIVPTTLDSPTTNVHLKIWPCFGAFDILVGIRFVPDYNSNNLSAEWSESRSLITWDANLRAGSAVYIRAICKKDFGSKWQGVCGKFDFISYSDAQALAVEGDITEIAEELAGVTSSLKEKGTVADVEWNKAGADNLEYSVLRYDYNGDYDSDGMLDEPLFTRTACGCQIFMDDVTPTLDFTDEGTKMATRIEGLDKNRITVFNILAGTRGGYQTAYTTVTIGAGSALAPVGLFALFLAAVLLVL